MLNENKLKLMTKLAIFKQENPDKFKLNDYYRRDYVGIKFLGNLLWLTVCYAIIIGIIAFIKMDEIMKEVNLDWIISKGTVILLIYVGILVASAVIGIFVYGRAHKRAKAEVREYYAGLSKLEKINRYEDTVKSIQRNLNGGE